MSHTCNASSEWVVIWPDGWFLGGGKFPAAVPWGDPGIRRMDLWEAVAVADVLRGHQGGGRPWDRGRPICLKAGGRDWRTCFGFGLWTRNFPPWRAEPKGDGRDAFHDAPRSVFRSGRCGECGAVLQEGDAAERCWHCLDEEKGYR